MVVIGNERQLSMRSHLFVSCFGIRDRVFVAKNAFAIEAKYSKFGMNYLAPGHASKL